VLLYWFLSCILSSNTIWSLPHFQKVNWIISQYWNIRRLYMNIWMWRRVLQHQMFWKLYPAFLLTLWIWIYAAIFRQDFLFLKVPTNPFSRLLAVDIYWYLCLESRKIETFLCSLNNDAVFEHLIYTFTNGFISFLSHRITWMITWMSSSLLPRLLDLLSSNLGSSQHSKES
jgi:hypothetical protein